MMRCSTKLIELTKLKNKEMDKRYYGELLYILGLTETLKNGIKSVEFNKDHYPNKTVSIFKFTALKDEEGNQKTGEINSSEYIIEFFNHYAK